MTVGNPKGLGHKLRVEDSKSWDAVASLLCQMERDGGSERKYAYKVNINAVYKLFDRASTPPPAPEKGIAKARPGIVRVTNLQDTPNLVEIVDLGDDSKNNDLNRS